MRAFIFFTYFLWGAVLSAQVYTVNSNDDLDDGVCDGIHCSLREAINAAEADGVSSTINFNIPGPGPHSIIPGGPFPTVTQDDLSIIGETQPGGAGSVIIDFNYRNFMGVGFWDILGKRFSVSGIGFTDFLFENNGDYVFQFGDPVNNAADSKIYNCAFITDNSLQFSSLFNLLISIYKADNMVISNNNFGTDHSKSFISKLVGFIQIESTQGLSKVVIDSNIFVNKEKMINGLGGDLSISKNIFGALDTSKVINFLDPKYGISGKNVKKALVHDNFFFGFKNYSVSFISSDGELIISKNRFYNCTSSITVGENTGGKYYVVDNYARLGGYFIEAINNQDAEFYIERNDGEDFTTFLAVSNQIGQFNKLVRYIDNRMACIFNNVVLTANPVPVVSSVNLNQTTGIGTPNDSIVVYFNERIGCPNANCQGGIELGRTKADVAGKWTLNANYPNKSSISAYQFSNIPNLNPNYYSAFSLCYECSGLIKINFNQAICSGQTINYRGKIYSEANPTDSIFVSGDGVSICDSVILVNLNYQKNYRFLWSTPVCYNDTVDFGSVKIYSGHLIDSLVLKSVNGCDSIIVITGKEVGVSNYTNSYCDTPAVRIGSTIFDKNNPSGIARIPGAAQSGCDSVVFVNLNFSFSSDSFINQTLCPGENLRIGNQLFDKSNPVGRVKSTNSTGCDSTIHVNLSYPDNTGFISEAICHGDSIKVVNQYFSASNPIGKVIIQNGSSFGCDSIIDVSLTINPPINLDFQAKDLKCNQANSGELIIDDIRGGSGNFKISIDSKPLVDYTPGMIEGNLFQGNHTIRISDALSCDTVYNFTINNSQLLDLQLPADTTIKRGNSVNISAFINFNSNKIIWDPANFLSCDTCLNTSSTPDNTITYTLTVSDENDCTISESMTITVLVDVADIYLPNAFSPNGDNINDLFKPEFKIPEKTRITIFQIFDRWGNMIYERTNGIEGESFGWDGSVDQEKMNPGVYAYIIQFVGEDGIAKWKRGDLTLIR